MPPFETNKKIAAERPIRFSRCNPKQHKCMRTKHAYNRTDLYRLFIQREHKDLYRNKQNNLYIQNDTLYSYGQHFIIAKWIKKDNDLYLIINSRKYSRTTTKHINEFIFTLNNMNCVPCENILYMYNPHNNVTDNLIEYHNKIFSLVNQYMKNHKKKNLIKEIAANIKTLEKYMEICNVSDDTIINVDHSFNGDSFIKIKDRISDIKKQMEYHFVDYMLSEVSL